MKNLLLPFLFILCIGLQAQAGNSDLFVIDEEQLEEEFANLNELENYVLENENTDLAALMTENPNLLTKLDLDATRLAMAFSPEFNPFIDMEWGAFAWGFCCGPVGVLIVLIGNQGNEYILSSLIGWGIGLIWWGGLFTIY